MTDASPEYGGSKFNGSKIRPELVDFNSIVMETAKVLTIGAVKYGDNNWKKGLPEEEIVGALLRHFNAFRNGERVDEDTGTDHRANMLCNMMFWLYLYPLKSYKVKDNFEAKLKEWNDKKK